jgi:two-component sensor histidine kinase
MSASPVEYQRQLRNLFSLLRVIVRRTAERTDDVEYYAAQLEGRIAALSRVHQMLMRAPGAELACGEIVSLVMPARRYSIDGPEVRIAGDAAGPVALALHELAVNALVHGAFSTADGHVAIEWKILDETETAWLQLEWRETASLSPRETAPVKGFGLEVIERTLTYELNARTSIAFSENGSHCIIQIPQDSVTPLWRASPEP